ncbi:MAG: hypothetical protein AAGG11_01740 [Pseudomonadota bacterium]
MFRQRARANLPTVLLTLASIIQAVALEMYWNRIADNEAMWALSYDALLGWLLAVAVLCGILLLWVYYAQLVMRFVWVPEIEDSLLPFGFGLLEFALIEFMDTAHIPIWFAIYGSVFLFAGWASYSTFTRAQRDPENRWFFTSGGINRRALLGPTIIAALLLWGFGLLCWVLGPPAHLILLPVTIAVTLQQLYKQHLHWRASLSLEDNYLAAAGNRASAESPHPQPAAEGRSDQSG